jgi:hypothetical protein
MELLIVKMTKFLAGQDDESAARRADQRVVWMNLQLKRHNDAR